MKNDENKNTDIKDIEYEKKLEEIKKTKISEEVNTKREKIKKVGFVIAAIVVILTIYAFMDGYFVDTNKFTKLLGKFGIFAPIIFIIIQTFLTVFPVSPSGITNVSVILAYGPVIGFLLNYIAIMIGSVINFFLGRKYGKDFIGLFFDEKTINKQIDWLNKGSTIVKMYIIVLIVPFLPDDISCMICGMTDFDFKKFFWITAIIKIWAIGLILIIMTYGYEFLYKWMF